MLDLNASFTSSTSFGGLISQLGTKIVYDLHVLKTMSLYETLANPMVLSTPIIEESGIYDVINSVETIDLMFNITANFGNDSRHFSYTSLDAKNLGSMVTSVLSTISIIAQDLLNTASHMVLMKSSPNSKGVVGKSQDYYIAFWAVGISVAFIFFNILYLCLYSGQTQRCLRSQTRRRNKQR